MALRMIGKDPGSMVGQSPTLCYDEERDTYLFQSWKVTDPERLAQLDIPDHETVIEFPAVCCDSCVEVSRSVGTLDRGSAALV